jgi:hypothetical protein
VEHVLQLDLCVISATLTFSDQFILPFLAYFPKTKIGLLLENEVRNNFWGYSSNSKNIFTLKKKIDRLMAGVKPRYSHESVLINEIHCKQPRTF